MGLTFKVSLPVLPDDPTAAAEIASGELGVVIAGADETLVIQTSREATEVEDERFKGPDGATVELEFVYIDDAGNRSADPAREVVTLFDTIPPVNPEAVGVMVTGEYADEVVSEDTPPEEPVA